MDILIRHVEPDDYQDIYHIHGQASVVEGSLQLPFPSQHNWQQKLANNPPNSHQLVACINNKVIGYLGVFGDDRARRKHVAELALIVSEDSQGMGVGSQLLEASIDLVDNWLNIVRFELEVNTDNARAIGLYQKYGFVIEGEMQMESFRHGQYQNAYKMARIHPAYRKKRTTSAPYVEV